MRGSVDCRWRTNVNTVPSLSHLRASGLLKALGVKHKLMVSAGEGLPIVDMAVEPQPGQQPIAVQVYANSV